MRAFDKKKLFRLFVKSRVLDGKVNQPDGSWTTAGGGNNVAHLRAGHRIDKRR